MVEIPHWSRGSVVLMGLINKTTPMEARTAYKYKVIDVYSDETIKDLLEKVAITLHRHIKNSSLIRSYCGKVRLKKRGASDRLAAY
nr:hypothetical protein CFP56_09243 [Quercus suber]